MKGAGRMDPVLDTLMTDPPPVSTMRGPTSAVRRNGPLRLRPTTFSHMVSVTSPRSP